MTWATRASWFSISLINRKAFKQASYVRAAYTLNFLITGLDLLLD